MRQSDGLVDRKWWKATAGRLRRRAACGSTTWPRSPRPFSAPVVPRMANVPCRACILTTTRILSVTEAWVRDPEAQAARRSASACVMRPPTWPPVVMHSDPMIRPSCRRRRHHRRQGRSCRRRRRCRPHRQLPAPRSRHRPNDRALRPCERTAPSARLEPPSWRRGWRTAHCGLPACARSVRTRTPRRQDGREMTSTSRVLPSARSLPRRCDRPSLHQRILSRRSKRAHADATDPVCTNVF